MLRPLTATSYLVLSHFFSEGLVYPAVSSWKENHLPHFHDPLCSRVQLHSTGSCNGIKQAQTKCLSNEGNGLHNLFTVETWSAWEWISMSAQSDDFLFYFMTPEYVSKSSHDRDRGKFTEINIKLPFIFNKAGISSSAKYTVQNHISTKKLL